MEKKFKVVAGVRKASFTPFDAIELEVVKSAKGRKMNYLECVDKNNNRHLIGVEELCALQEDNQDVDIIIDANGKRAKIGDDGFLNPAIAIGRNTDGLLTLL